MRLWSPKYWRMFFIGAASALCAYIVIAAWRHDVLSLFFDSAAFGAELWIIHSLKPWTYSEGDEDEDNGGDDRDTEPIVPTPWGDAVEAWLREQSRQGV